MNWTYSTCPVASDTRSSCLCCATSWSGMNLSFIFLRPHISQEQLKIQERLAELLSWIFPLSSLRRSGWSGRMVERCRGQWSSQSQLLLIQTNAFFPSAFISAIGTTCWSDKAETKHQLKNRNVSKCKSYLLLHLQVQLLPSNPF